MNQKQQRMQVVGTGAMSNLSRAMHYFEQLAVKVSDAEETLTYLDDSIESARVDLEECLRGHDTFDALAFLRFAAGPWDFGEVRESETLVETSQAAQDVVAIALLGMGLPRQPLTGENSGQPDIGKAMGLAADIVEAARTRALVQGRQLKQPLGPLAGEFLGYELSVRGRQYESIATEINTELLGDVAVQAVLESALGCHLPP